MNFITWFKEVLSDNCGQGSAARVTMLLSVVAYLIWSSYIVYITKTLPDIPTALATLIGGLYGINKIGPNINIGSSKGE